MSSRDPGKVDRIIDEALRGLTAGAPREGFRGRVMARIAATPEPSPIRFIEILGWRVRPLHLATAGVLASIGLVATLVIPRLLQTGGPRPAETTSGANPLAAAASKPAAAPDRQAGVRQQTQAASLSPQSTQRRATIQRAADVSRPRFGDEPAGTGTIRPVRVDPLPAPDPIAISAIEIQPIEIEQLTIADIQVPLLEGGRTPRDNRERE